MGLGKKYIVKNITSKTQISNLESIDFLEAFLLVSKKNLNHLKISSFSSYVSNLTPQRVGRNPKTNQEYIIPERHRFSFKPSKIISNKLN